MLFYYYCNFILIKNPNFLPLKLSSNRLKVNQIHNSLSISFITTSVEPCTCSFTHQVFGAVAGELLQFD